MSANANSMYFSGFCAMMVWSITTAGSRLADDDTGPSHRQITSKSYCYFFVRWDLDTKAKFCH